MYCDCVFVAKGKSDFKTLKIENPLITPYEFFEKQKPRSDKI